MDELTDDLFQLLKQGEVATRNYKDQILFMKTGIKCAAASSTFFIHFVLHYFNKILKRKKV